MKTLVDLGDEFRALRKAAGLTQEEVAARLHMKQEALSRFERGRGSDFSAAKLLRLAQALGQELQFVQARKRPTLDDVLEERRQAVNSGPASR
jgi:HTH-type transcriptional regulator / antitoxin HipB